MILVQTINKQNNYKFVTLVPQVSQYVQYYKYKIKKITKIHKGLHDIPKQAVDASHATQLLGVKVLLVKNDFLNQVK